MDLQAILACAVVAVAFLLLVRGAVVRRRRARAGLCGGSCGCETRSPFAERVKRLGLKPGERLL